ncbi:hypothetical protein Taro_010453 [Colocasia esculenta]|uniref:Pentatricopeptide repeat-containing protein n=1 Tax=Colocasia esculenta TaxID=4460 RepID=A0A843U3B4_COLES|nr:hypothetical protein [Colocasia esculenta]
MRRLSLPPDLHTFPFALKACAHLGGDGGHRLGRALHSQAVKFGFDGDEFVSNTLISVYANSSASVAVVQRLFDHSSHRDVVSYNTLIDGYVKAGEMTQARKIFDEMPVRDVVSYGTLLAGYSRSNRCEDALQLFDSLLASGIRPDDVSLVTALSACAQLGALDRGQSIHNYIAHHRTRPNVFLSTGLVDMYAKCGCIDTAREVFECCPRKNLFTWNAIVVGLGMHGHGHLSLEYFNRMQAAGVQPDGVTLLGALIGCSHAGLIDTAQKLFDDMTDVYGIERELKHYGCMSDMLGRAGLIEEAMEMIEGMPMEGDEYVWGGVLGGCRIHGNVEVAEIAAAHLLEINPEDSGIYSVLANIYASARRWKDVSRIRRLMDERKGRGKQPSRNMVVRREPVATWSWCVYSIDATCQAVTFWFPGLRGLTAFGVVLEVGVATWSRHPGASRHGCRRAGPTRRVFGAVGLKPRVAPHFPLSPFLSFFFPLLPLSSPLAISRWLFVLVVLVLRWCRPVRAGDVFVVLGARRRWSFRREGPNRSALLVEVGTLDPLPLEIMLSPCMLPSPCGMFVLCFGVVSERIALKPPSAEDATTIGRRDKATTAWATVTMSRQGRASRQGRDGPMCRDYSKDRLRSCEVLCFCGVFIVSASYCTRGTSASFLVRFYASRSLGARHLRACPVRDIVTVVWDSHPRVP